MGVATDEISKWRPLRRGPAEGVNGNRKLRTLAIENRALWTCGAGPVRGARTPGSGPADDARAALARHGSYRQSQQSRVGRAEELVRGRFRHSFQVLQELTRLRRALGMRVVRAEHDLAVTDQIHGLPEVVGEYGRVVAVTLERLDRALREIHHLLDLAREVRQPAHGVLDAEHAQLRMALEQPVQYQSTEKVHDRPVLHGDQPLKGRPLR